MAAVRRPSRSRRRRTDRGSTRRLAGVVLAVSLALLLLTSVLSASAFTTFDVDRVVSVGASGDSSALVAVDPADEVSLACSEPLVAVTNNLNDRATIEVRILEDRDGEVFLDRAGESRDRVSFDLDSGERRTVYVTGVRGPPHDEVEFEITAESADVHVAFSERVPKVPGNEDGDDDGNEDGGDGDGNRGDDDCRETERGDE